MTFFLGWKADDSVFLVADTAVTQLGAGVVSPPRKHTAFGEPHVFDPKQGRRVAEEVLKIAQIGRLSFVFAGSEKVGMAIGRTLRAGLSYSDAAGEVFAAAIKENFSEIQRSPFQCAIAYHDGSTARLISASSESPFPIDRNIFSGGSMFRTLVQRLEIIPSLLNQQKLLPKEQLMVFVAMMQTYNVYNGLINLGIGGAYQGIMCNKNGISYTPFCTYCRSDGTRVLETKLLFCVMQRPHAMWIKRGLESSAYILTEKLQWKPPNASGFIPYENKEQERAINYMRGDYVCLYRSDYKQTVILENRSTDGAPMFSIPEDANIRVALTIDAALAPWLFDVPIPPLPNGQMRIHFVRPKDGGVQAFSIETITF